MTFFVSIMFTLCQRAGLVKLRRVLRAIRRHFPQPPEEMLNENPIDKFLDSFDLCEDKLYEAAVSDGSQETIFSIAFPDGRVFKVCKTLSTGRYASYKFLMNSSYSLFVLFYAMTCFSNFQR